MAAPSIMAFALALAYVPPVHVALPLMPRPTLSRCCAQPRMESWFRIRHRLRQLFKSGGAATSSSAADPAQLPISAVLAMANVSKPVSACFTEAISSLASEEPATTFSFAGTSIGQRVGIAEKWMVATTGENGRLVDCSFSSGTPACDARLQYRDEATFVALMDDSLGSAAAVATGRLRISGSLDVAKASEELYVAAEEALRRVHAVAALSAQEVDALRQAEREERAAAWELRLTAAAERSPIERWRARHVGTDQQIGAWLLVFGSVLYTGYCALVLSLADAADVVATELYLASSVLWLCGSVALIHSSYPERVTSIATTAEADARDPTRLQAMGGWERYAGASSLLLSAWGLGLGAPTFLAGAMIQTASHPADPVAYAYDFAGLYLLAATGALVLGSLPASLAEADGAGSTHLQRFLVGRLHQSATFWGVHAANDLLAGTIFFAAFMVGCLTFGVLDLLAEPSALALCFAISQLPFAAGAVLLARSTYPEGINRASVWGESVDEDVIMDELLLRKRALLSDAGDDADYRTVESRTP